MLLSLPQLIDFDDEFANFFSNDPLPEGIGARECVYHPIQHPRIQVSDPPPEGWILLRKAKDSVDTFLLIEIGPAAREWKSWFAVDPKKVLAFIQSDMRLEWSTLFPLIRQAHKEAHPTKDNEPNLTYLQDVIVRALHSFSPLNAVRSIISELDNPTTT
jgi:hypothetical protein